MNNNISNESSNVPDWGIGLNQAQRKRIRKGAEKYGCTPEYYLENREELTGSPTSTVTSNNNSEVPDWGKELSATARKRVREQAKRYNCSPEEYINNREAILMRHQDSVVDKSKSKTGNSSDKQRLKRYRRKARERGLTLEEYVATIDVNRKTNKQSAKSLVRKMNNENIRNIKAPDYVEVITWDSPEMKELIEQDTSFKQAKGIVYQLKPGGNSENRHKTFIDGNKSMSKHEVKSLLFKDVISDSSMLPIEEKFATTVGDKRALPFHEWGAKVFEFWQPIEFNPDSKVFAIALDWLKSTLQDMISNTFELDVLYPLTIEHAYEKVTKGRNSGYPFYTSKWHLDPSIVKYYRDQAEELVNGKPIDDYRILFKRTQNKGDTVKMRPVMCPPKSEAIAAKTFTDLFITMFKETEQFCGFLGGTNLGHIVSPILEDYETLVSSDFSAFDTRCKHLIKPIFETIKALVHHKYHDYFDNMIEYYQYSKLITPFGIISSDKPNGLSSGDGWTSVIGTLANALANKYCELMMNINLKVLSFGDDCVLATNDDFSIDEYAKFMSELGMECNPAKQEFTKGENRHFSFLGYYYFYQDVKAGTPVDKLHKFPIMRALSTLLFYENPMKLENLMMEMDGDLSAEEKDLMRVTKIIGLELLAHLQRLENCCNHPDFTKFVKVFKQYEPNSMDTNLILPFEKLTDAMRHIRRQKGKGLQNNQTLQLLYALEGKDYDALVNQIPNVKPESLAIVVYKEQPKAIQVYTHTDNGSEDKADHVEVCRETDTINCISEKDLCLMTKSDPKVKQTFTDNEIFSLREVEHILSSMSDNAIKRLLHKRNQMITSEERYLDPNKVIENLEIIFKIIED